MLDTPINDPDKVVAGSATTMKVEVTANDLYLLKLECLIIYSAGKEKTKTRTMAFITNKPYCDGNHKKIAFKEYAFLINQFKIPGCACRNKQNAHDHNYYRPTH